MSIEQKKNFIINVIFYAIVILLVYGFIQYVLSWLLPFILGFLLIMVLQPVVKRIVKAFKIKKSGKINILLLVGIYALLVFIIVQIFISLSSFISEQIVLLPELYENYVQPNLVSFFDFLSNHGISILGTNLAQLEENVLSVLQSLSTSISSGVIDFISALVVRIPSFMVSVIITIVASIYIANDYEHILQGISSIIPAKSNRILYELKDYITSTLAKVFIAYGKIMCVTFCELTVGLTILGVENSILVAMAIAIFDIIPVLGTGGIILPWAVIDVICGNYYQAIGFLIMYCIITVVRNIIEPKFVGQQIGIHPVLMLIGLYVGAKLFGVMGMFLVPIIFIIVRDLYDKGIILSYNKEK